VALTRYPDISGYQAGISLAGAPAVCCKATQGTGYTSPAYRAQTAEGDRRGIVTFAYHFLEAGNPGGQAAHAHSVTGKRPLMVDFEPTTGSSPRLADCTGFIDAYRKAGGVTYLVYLPHWYWQQIGSPSLKPLQDRHMLLVSSSYPAGGYSDNGVGWAAYGGMTPAIWQYSSNQPFGGQRIDFNAFKGTAAELRSLVSTGKKAAPPPPPAPAPTEDEMPNAIRLPETIGGVRTVSWATGTAKGITLITDTGGPVTFKYAEYHTQPTERWLAKPDIVVGGAQGGRVRVDFNTPDDCTAVELTLTAGSGTTSLHT